MTSDPFKGFAETFAKLEAVGRAYEEVLAPSRRAIAQWQAQMEATNRALKAALAPFNRLTEAITRLPAQTRETLRALGELG
jgi:hypothetical protein